MPDVNETVEFKPRKETLANLALAIPVDNEFGVVTDLKQLILGDGATLGGGARFINLTQMHQAKHWFATVTGTNTLTFDLGAPYRPAAYTTGHVIAFKPAANNTTAVTINVTGSGGTGLGAKDLQKIKNGALAALAAGDLVAGAPNIAIYDGTRYVLVSGSGGGTWENIDSDSISNQTSSDFQSIPDTALIERFVLDKVRPQAQSALWLRVEVAAAFRATSGDYNFAAHRITSEASAAADGATADTKIILTGTIDNAALRGLSGIVEIFNPGAGNRPYVRWDLAYFGTGTTGTFHAIGKGSFIGTTGAVTGVRFLQSTDNIAAGTIYRQRLSTP
jgi:hypothetical protein